ncbi:hypothetical protein KKP04_03380 [Rhodomicrobium sp. Az07]|uniref:hypothetical protein n=1 Tax=Rhodomicrobium sp. Az07 TaxID=2839034 RepID=UPI001BE7D653|nr:hypothetical protein [Rhodomicrobium sp. Az07]MBT3069909.1 hypothetical protein [Rhodomicrobium sp. Az07]
MQLEPVFPMSTLRLSAFALAMTFGIATQASGGEPREIRSFVKKVFEEKIEDIKTGIYCRAFSCEFEVESFFATETDPKTYALSTTGWLEGTIPGLDGSARRAMGLTASYTRGTCIVKDVKPIFDKTTNNNGWGASKVEAVFKRIEIPTIVVLTPEDCKKVDEFIFAGM